jgi:hypothetical protein
MNGAHTSICLTSPVAPRGTLPNAEKTVATVRRYWPWLLFAMAGVACSRLFAVEQGTSPFLAEDVPSGLSGVALSAVAPRAPEAAASTEGAATESPARAGEHATASAVTHLTRSLSTTATTVPSAGARAGKPAAALSHPALTLAAAEPASAEERLALASTELALAARSNAPGRTWQDAAKTADWAGVA